jgi:hypothetical protein
MIGKRVYLYAAAFLLASLPAAAADAGPEIVAVNKPWISYRGDEVRVSGKIQNRGNVNGSAEVWVEAYNSSGVYEALRTTRRYYVDVREVEEWSADFRWDQTSEWTFSVEVKYVQAEP